jgi:hypothetical protein
MQKKLTQLFLFIILIAAFLWGRQWWQAQQLADLAAEPAATESLAEEMVVEPARQYTFTVESDGQSALALVETQVELQLKEYDFGVMIEGVNGLLADSGHYWALHLNGEAAMVGIADLELVAGDQLELIYEEIVF